jgi:hypothetical protein
MQRNGRLMCSLLSKLLHGLCLCLTMNGYQNPQQDVTTL